MKLELKEKYVQMRAQGEQSEEAFESAVQPVGSLIEAVKAGNIRSNPFYSKIEGYLKQVKEAGWASITYKRE